jgi:hypothetical protein
MMEEKIFEEIAREKKKYSRASGDGLKKYLFISSWASGEFSENNYLLDTCAELDERSKLKPPKSRDGFDE